MAGRVLSHPAGDLSTRTEASERRSTSWGLGPTGPWMSASHGAQSPSVCAPGERLPRSLAMAHHARCSPDVGQCQPERWRMVGHARMFDRVKTSVSCRRDESWPIPSGPGRAWVGHATPRPLLRGAGTRAARCDARPSGRRAGHRPAGHEKPPWAASQAAQARRRQGDVMGRRRRWAVGTDPPRHSWCGRRREHHQQAGALVRQLDLLATLWRR